MPDFRGILAITFMALLAARAQVVQIVTPEPVDFVTEEQDSEGGARQPEGQNGAGFKREASNGTMDSYLEALKESHGSSNRYDPPPTNELYQPEDHQGEISYGPPKGYQPKPASYHSTPTRPSPSFMYGPPAPVPSYLPAQPTAPPSGFYGMPFAAGIPQNIISSVVSSLMPKGLDLEVVFKILMKLALFKMIVKFIAVLCLMMAWPLFQSKDKDMMEMEDDKRQFDALNDLTDIVWKSIFPKNTTEVSGDDDDDGTEMVEKVAGEINEKMTVPSEEAAIGFLEFCVAAANTAVGWMMSFVRRRNNEMDPIEQFLWSLWENIKSRITTVVVEDSHLTTI